MFIDDYALQNREEAIDRLIQGVLLENNLWHKDRNFLVGRQEVYVWSLSEILTVFLRKTRIFN